MAHINIYHFIGLGLDEQKHTATSYQIAKDAGFKEIIDQSLYDTVNLLFWNSPLPKGDGTYYKDMKQLHARVKIHFNESSSPWYVLKPDDQTVQNVVLTGKNKLDTFTTSRELEWS